MKKGNNRKIRSKTYKGLKSTVFEVLVSRNSIAVFCYTLTKQFN